MKRAALFLAVLFLAACTKVGPEEPDPPPQVREMTAFDFDVFEDRQRGVTCYHRRGYVGLACVRTTP